MASEKDAEDTAMASDLQDRRGGAFDNVAPKPEHPGRMHSTPHEAAQHGADVRAETEPTDDSLPAGLMRERKHPLNPSTGRGTEIPKHVPKNFDPKR